MWPFKKKSLPAPQDPDTLTNATTEQQEALVQARIAAGLKPWPQRPDNHYFNTVQAHCSVCNVPIYGGQAISSGWDVDGHPEIWCHRHRIGKTL